MLFISNIRFIKPNIVWFSNGRADRHQKQELSEIALAWYCIETREITRGWRNLLGMDYARI